MICSIGTSPDEMNFFRTLRSEIKKIGDFFVKEQAAYISIVGSLEAQFSNLQVSMLYYSLSLVNLIAIAISHARYQDGINEVMCIIV